VQLEFSGKISKNPHISNFIQIRPAGANLCHADGRTDGDTETSKVIAVFGNFVKSPSNWRYWVTIKPVSQHPLQVFLLNRFILIRRHAKDARLTGQETDIAQD
jgi:hypothetical protein